MFNELVILLQRRLNYASYRKCFVNLVNGKKKAELNLTFVCLSLTLNTFQQIIRNTSVDKTASITFLTQTTRARALLS